MADSPILSVCGLGGEMTIELRVTSPIADMDFFNAVAGLLAARLKELRQPTPGELEMRSWTAE